MLVDTAAWDAAVEEDICVADVATTADDDCCPANPPPNPP